MHLHPTWIEIAVRLLLTAVAGGLIGFNRGEHGHAAGLRTTLLVSLAAAMAMIEANLLLVTQASGIGIQTFDVLRLPLGILSGIGFIGAGAIVRRGEMMTGVTTAATLWFVTVIGICFGGGQLEMGIAGTLLAIGILWGLKSIDRRMGRTHRATLVVIGDDDAEIDSWVRECLAPTSRQVNRTGGGFTAEPRRFEWRGEVRWRGALAADAPIAGLDELAKRPGVQSVSWIP